MHFVCLVHRHHALNTGKDEGFVFTICSIAAKYIQQKHNKRILIIDWDYHHGNATELFFTVIQMFFVFQLII